MPYCESTAEEARVGNLQAGFFGRIAMIKPKILMPIISLLCLVGVYGVRNSFFDVWVMIFSGIIGFVLLKWKYPIAPLVIGLILGPMTENNLRKSLMMYKGDISMIFQRPVTVIFFSIAILFISYGLISSYSRRQKVLPTR
jgi:putative tricarboxylic transport membrane protein